MGQNTIQDCVALGRKVRKLRRDQKVTQVQLAGLANTGTRFVSDLGNGKMLRVLNALGVDMLIRSPYDKE